MQFNTILPNLLGHLNMSTDKEVQNNKSDLLEKGNSINLSCSRQLKGICWDATGKAVKKPAENGVNTRTAK